ncbi:MAG: histidinol-phosphatase HisJ family protein [Anaerolineae bacterium]
MRAAWVDYHVHSRHSPDARGSMSALAEAAREAGLRGLAFTEHVEWYAADSATGHLQPARYFAEMEALRARLNGETRLFAGLEVGNSHEFVSQTRALLEAAPWDYVLGSLHWPGGEAGWKPSAFVEGLEVAYRRYFEELVVLAQEGLYDVLAHFDLIRRDSWSICRQTLPLQPYASLIRAALAAVVERGKGLEINTSAMAAGLPEPCPNLTVLRWYRELGGEILVFGSDAHAPPQVGQYFDRAQMLALEAGFERLACFEGRRVVGWTPLR